MTHPQIKCHGCGHYVPKDYVLRTQGFCYLCDPNITLEEAISEDPILKIYHLSLEQITLLVNAFTDITLTNDIVLEEINRI